MASYLPVSVRVWSFNPIHSFRERRERFQIPAEVADALSPFAVASPARSSAAEQSKLSRQTAAQPTKAPPRRGPLVVAALAGLALVLIAAAVFYIQLGKTTLRFEIGDPNLAVIQSLRMYAESSNGEIPARLDEDGINEASSRYSSYVVQRDEAAQVQRSREEQAQDFLPVVKGFTFATALATDEKWDAHYAGAGVKLGDTDRPIFWYKPADSEKYRVIYADLSAGEVDADPIVADAVRLAP